MTKNKNGKDQTQSSMDSFAKKKATAAEIRQRLLRATTLAIVSMGIPQRAVLNEHFRSMQQKFADAGSRAPKQGFGIDSVKVEVKNMVAIMKARVKDRLRGKVIHGTTDHWTSRDNRAFESLCFHWIENFELVSLNVECKEFIGSTKSEKLVENYVKRLTDWNITGKPDKQNQYICRENTILATCTTDTESKMNKFGMQLESEYFVTAIYCTDHVIQATAVIAYSSRIFSDDDTTDAFGKGLVGKCRKLVQFFTTSSQRQQDLCDVQHELGQRARDPVVAYRDANQPYKVVQDVVVRWWSTYAMIQRLIILKPALERLDAEKKLRNSTDRANSPSRMLTDPEWGHIESLAGLLQPWKVAQQVLESEKIVTSSLVLPHLRIVYDKLATYIKDAEESPDDDDHQLHLSASLVDLARRMMDDFKKRWGDLDIPFHREVARGAQKRQVGIHPNFVLAHALDPRFKNLSFISNEDNKEELWGAILEEMVVARKQQQLAQASTPNSLPGDSANSETAGIGASTIAERPNKRLKTSASSDWDKYVLRETEDDLEEAVYLSSITLMAECKMELSKYRTSRGLQMFANADKRDMNDPLQAWWKLHHMSYPTVWLLAQYYLGIPATSASSERSFSVAGRILNPLAAGSTRSDNFEDTHFLRQNMDMFLDED